MKQLITFSVVGISLFLKTNAQNTFPSSGYAGIGTTTPVNPLEIVSSNISCGTFTNNITTTGSNIGSFGSTSKLNISSGNFTTVVGIYGAAYNSGVGTATDLRGFQANVVVDGSGNVINGKAFLANFATLSTGVILNGYAFYMGSFPSNVSNKYGIYISDANASNYFGGNVGIGTTSNSGYKLAVNGSAIFTEAHVKLYANWPDYVFNKHYKLLPLKDLEDYISRNNHLPNMPAASDVQNKGINLGDMNAKLLEKIEELTLYMIELKKENEEIRKENKEIKQQLNRVVK